MKSLTFWLKVFVLVVVEIGVVLGLVLKSIVGWCWFGLVLRNICKREICWVFKGNAVKNLSKPLFLFWL